MHRIELVSNRVAQALLWKPSEWEEVALAHVAKNPPESWDAMYEFSELRTFQRNVYSFHSLQFLLIVDIVSTPCLKNLRGNGE